MVEKFKLFVEDHPESYRVDWMKGVELVEVNLRCFVSYSIKKYVDEVLCYVGDVDAWHMLHVRPWQYDIDATHSRHDNNYHFIKDAKNIILVPFKSSLQPYFPILI